jgi:hypothetical protein
MPRRPSPADQLADAVRSSIDGQAVDLSAALDTYSTRTGYRARSRRRMQRAGGGRQTVIGWTIAEMAKRAGVEHAAAAKIVRGLVGSGRVVRLGRGRFLDAERGPVIRTRRSLWRMGDATSAIEATA